MLMKLLRSNYSYKNIANTKNGVTFTNIELLFDVVAESHSQ